MPLKSHNQLTKHISSHTSYQVTDGDFVNSVCRFIMLRGSPGFYSYGILEHLDGWPDVNIYQGRIVFKLALINIIPGPNFLVVC